MRCDYWKERPAKARSRSIRQPSFGKIFWRPFVYPRKFQSRFSSLRSASRRSPSAFGRLLSLPLSGSLRFTRVQAAIRFRRTSDYLGPCAPALARPPACWPALRCSSPQGRAVASLAHWNCCSPSSGSTRTSMGGDQALSSTLSSWSHGPRRDRTSRGSFLVHWVPSLIVEKFAASTFGELSPAAFPRPERIRFGVPAGSLLCSPHSHRGHYGYSNVPMKRLGLCVLGFLIASRRSSTRC